MEGERRESYARSCIDAFRRGAKIRTESGDSCRSAGRHRCLSRRDLRFRAARRSNRLLRIRTASGEIVLKSYKLLDPRKSGGRHPGSPQARKFPHTARLLGEMALGRQKDASSSGSRRSMLIPSTCSLGCARVAPCPSGGSGDRRGTRKACRGIASISERPPRAPDASSTDSGTLQTEEIFHIGGFRCRVQDGDPVPRDIPASTWPASPVIRIGLAPRAGVPELLLASAHRIEETLGSLRRAWVVVEQSSIRTNATVGPGPPEGR